ncbi:MAG TPA: pyridoxine 5'-phosphate synthase [Gammaproteobacteria bacterium]|nr:pyridoxine 5'-phosphate synthase [Gammaproteobacteria bacterium]
MNQRVQTKLSVNLNKVALLRNQRDVGYPSVIEAARLVIDSGAAGITVHPRPDERHIRRSDVYELARFLEDEHGGRVEFNIEGNPTESFIALVLEVRPAQVTLVPDSPEQRTSDHGWDFARHAELLRPIVARIEAAGIRVSVFVDPGLGPVEGAADVRAQRIELYTEPYAAAYAAGDYGEVLEEFARSAEAAHRLGLGVNAGHDLNLDNLRDFRAAIPMLAEVSIGHAITADALNIGFPAAVAAYLEALK